MINPVQQPLPPSPEQFILPSNYPEFASEDRELIARFLVEASEFCPEFVWGKGELRTRAIALYTAKKLAERLIQMSEIASLSVLAARGENSFPQPVDPSQSVTFYEREFQSLYARLPKTGFVC